MTLTADDFACLEEAERQDDRDRLAVVQSQIATYQSALTAAATGASSSSLDTGQTRTSMTKATVGQLRKQLDSLLNERAIRRARLYGGGFICQPHS